MRTMLCTPSAGVARRGNLSIDHHLTVDTQLRSHQTPFRTDQAIVGHEMMVKRSAGTKSSIISSFFNLISDDYHLSASMIGLAGQQQVSYQLQKPLKVGQTYRFGRHLKWPLYRRHDRSTHGSGIRQAPLGSRPQRVDPDETKAPHRAVTAPRRTNLACSGARDHFSSLNGTKAAGLLGSATASFKTLNTRWSIGVDATKSA